MKVDKKKFMEEKDAKIKGIKRAIYKISSGRKKVRSKFDTKGK